MSGGVASSATAVIDDLLRAEIGIVAVSVAALGLLFIVALLGQPRNESKRGRHR